MANYDENISFKQGSDTGEANNSSIVPITDSEVVWSGSTNRPVENLRARTEILRRALQNVLYYQDYDRGLLLRSEALFSLTQPTPGNYELVSTGDLWVYPPLTPGLQSGGRWNGGRVFFGDYPYLGVSESAGLVLTVSASTTGQRGYADGDTLATSTVFSLGANRITVDLVADPALATGAFNYTVTQMPATKVTITYGTQSGSPTHAQLIASLNADTTSQGSYGVSQILFASSPNAATLLTNFTGAVVQGGYDAEAHKVTQAQLAALFAATVGGVNVNRLQNGEGLAIGYPSGPVQAYTAPFPRGGRRQSIFDLPTDRIGGTTNNVTPPTGYSLFNTGREPEKIAGAVPLGKLVVEGGQAEFVFIDGTRVRVGEAPIALGDTSAGRRALSSTSPGSSGAMLVGYSGSGNWNPNATTAPTALPAGNLENTIDAIVTQLGGYGSNVAGARRVGFEGLTGTVSTGNTAFDLNGLTPTSANVQSLHTALERLLNSPDTSGGLNYRVSEKGHRMKGFSPLEKVFSEIPTDAGGGQFLRGVLNPAPTSGPTPNGIVATGQVEDHVQVSLLPASFDTGILGEVLLENEPIQPGGVGYVEFTTLSLNAATLIRDLFVLTNTASDLHCVVEIKGTGATDGFYFAKELYVGTPSLLYLSLLKGTLWTGTLTGPGTLTFYVTHIQGNSVNGVRTRKMVHEKLPDADEHIYGVGRIRRGYAEDGSLRFEESVNEAAWSKNLFSASINSGTNLTAAAAGPGLIQITGISGMQTGFAGSIGRYLSIGSAPNIGLNGTWLITQVNSATDIVISCPATGALGAQAGATWVERRDFSRKTNNILIEDDARLLKGQQLGTVRDATLSHHHGGAYTYLHIPAPQTPFDRLVFFNSGVVQPTINDISSVDYFDPAWFVPGTTLPAGYQIVGIFANCAVTIVATVAYENPWNLQITTSPGTAVDPANYRYVIFEDGVKISTTVADTITKTFTTFIPTDTQGRAAFDAAATGINVNTSNFSVVPSLIAAIRI